MTIKEGVTPEQIAAIEELRQRTVNDVTPKMLEDESLFYRFMKARDFNLENAEDMLRKHIAWRKEYEIDTILTHYKPSEVALKYLSMNNIIGYDDEGCPVRYVDAGNLDIMGILNSLTKTEILKFNFQIFERDMEILRNQSAKLGRCITNVNYVYNVENYSFAKATNKRVIEISLLCNSVYQDNYPERIKRIYVINASIYFTLLYSFLKPALAPAIIEKVRVFGSNGWKESLLELMGADQLPAFLGGNRTDPDGNPLCHSVIIHCSPVPKHYYFSEVKQRFSLLPGVKVLKLAPLAKIDLKFEVEEPDSILEWEFGTKNKDIEFGVYYKENSCVDTSVVELVPKQRIETCYEPQAGLCKCERIGTYTIVFDNSYSWIHPKEIYYKAKVIGPEEKDK